MIRQYLYLAIAGALLVLGMWLYHKGGDGERAAKREVTETRQSNAVSRDTQQRVDVQGEEVRQRTANARESIDARRDPAAGPADPDVLRIAREAHERAIRASCRVQRTGDCPEAAAAP